MHIEMPTVDACFAVAQNDDRRLPELHSNSGRQIRDLTNHAFSVAFNAQPTTF
jgi:hypothetical protein